MIKGTHSATRTEALQGRKWWVVDVADQTVGRAASQVSIRASVSGPVR